ncbi:MAG: hypothetical protein JSV79_13905 [Armatimonadota bacterium]|nr:MAG: hypothetical protein JSV79_13905 [Armatimonadota bacterium]
MKFNRREMALLLGVVVVAWAAILLGLAKWQRSRSPSSAEPELAHYPGTEQVQEQTSENLGLRKYWFLLNEDYPSKSVYHFYRDHCRQKGWRIVNPGEPQWYRRSQSGKFYDLFSTTWISPDGLFQLELQMKSEVTPIRHEGEVVGEERAPGIKVYVTQRRVLVPGFMVRPDRGGEPASEIEVP